MTPEGRIKEGVKKVLRSYGVYWHCPVQNGLGAPSLDFVCCYLGRFFAIETKAGAKDMTPRQHATAQQMTAAGGRVFRINAKTGTEELVLWLEDNKCQ